MCVGGGGGGGAGGGGGGGGGAGHRKRKKVYYTQEMSSICELHSSMAQRTWRKPQTMNLMLTITLY